MNKNIHTQKYTTLSKSELAFQYSPDITPGAALNRLSRLIKGDRDLYQSLLATGYQDAQRILSIKQVNLIYEYLGEPN